MLTLPQIITRPAQTCAYVRFTVRMDEMHKPAEVGFPIAFETLAEQGIQPIGAAFYN